MTQNWPVHPDRTLESQKEPSKRPKARPHPGISEEGPGSYSVYPEIFEKGPTQLSCAADHEKHCPRSPERNELLDPTREGGPLRSPGNTGHPSDSGWDCYLGTISAVLRPTFWFCWAFFLGQVQSRKCIEDVIHFAWEEKLFLLADEVRAASAIATEGGLWAEWRGNTTRG